jgi:hypothetical protein
MSMRSTKGPGVKDEGGKEGLVGTKRAACSVKRARFNIVYKLFSAQIAISIQIGSPRTSGLPVERTQYLV